MFDRIAYDIIPYTAIPVRCKACQAEIGEDEISYYFSGKFHCFECYRKKIKENEEKMEKCGNCGSYLSWREGEGFICPNGCYKLYISGECTAEPLEIDLGEYSGDEQFFGYQVSSPQSIQWAYDVELVVKGEKFIIPKGDKIVYKRLKKL